MKHQTLIEKLTLEEKAALLGGRGEWDTWAIPRLGIPAMILSDGPHGIRRQAGAGDHLGLNESLPATCFPTAATKFALRVWRTAGMSIWRKRSGKHSAKRRWQRM